MSKLNSLKGLLLISAVTLSLNSVYAVVDVVDEQNNSINQKVLSEQILDKKSNKQNSESVYTNDIHSVFTLEDCVNIAVKHNPMIQAAVYNAQVYKSKIGQEWANYFPVLNVGIQGSTGNTKYSVPYVNSFGKNTLGYLPQLSGEMLLFDFGKTKANADKAKREYEAKEYDTGESINNLIYQIKAAYFNILFAQAQVKVYNDTVADYELQLKRAQSFYNAGKKAKIDVITAEYNLGKAKLNYVKAVNVLDVANAQLSMIMGIPEYTNYELSSQLGTEKYEITQEDAIKKALEVRPELISAQKTVDAAKLSLRAKRRDYAPNLGAFASYNNGIGNEYNVSSYQVGVGLNYSALNILKIKKQIDEATASYEKSLADFQNVKNSVFLDVKKTYLELKTCEEAIVIAKLALDEAQEQYRQVSGRYKAGVGDFIELKDGETTFLNARLDFYNSLLNYNTTVAKLEKEVGMPLVPSNENVLKDF